MSDTFGNADRHEIGGVGTVASVDRTLRRVALAVVVLAALLAYPGTAPPAVADDGLVLPGEVLRVEVPEAFGGKTVLGQLTVDRATTRGFVTAYACAAGPPRNERGEISRSDLNFNGEVSPVSSNRLIVEADDAGDICFVTHAPVALIVDVNATSFDTGITSIANRRTDTRTRPAGQQTVAAGTLLRVNVPEAAGGRTVIGQLTVDRATERGFVTAYPCAGGLPQANGETVRSDLNVNGQVSPVASNRLVVEADDAGDVCFYTQRELAIIVDVNGITDAGIDSFINRRTDTRINAPASRRLAPGDVLQINVPEAAGGRAVLGQLTVDNSADRGFLTAYACEDGLPRNNLGQVSRSDLNVDGTITPVASNRLLVDADGAGNICIYTQRALSIIVDVNATATSAAISVFPNRRVDTRNEGGPPGGPTLPPGGTIPTWPPYTPEAPLDGVAALTGRAAGSNITTRPILATKIDNFSRARPQFGLDGADAVFELNAEGITRFIALFHTNLPDRVGPVRSARTADLDLLAGMNRPVFSYSGANPGVTAWNDAAAGAGVISDFSAQRNACFERTADRPGPHNLLHDPTCAVNTALTRAAPPGPARPLWSIDAAWAAPPSASSSADSAFTVPMDGVAIEWRWTGSGYVRFQDGAPHVATSGAQIRVDNVVEIRTEHPPSPVDARSPNPISVGAGSAVVHRDGRAYTASWSRPSPYDRFSFFDPASGLPILLDEGTTWVHLVRA